MYVKSIDVQRIRYNNIGVIEILKTFLPKSLPTDYDIGYNKFVIMIKKLEESDNILLYGLDRKDDWSK